MSKSLELYNQILFLELRPWATNTSEFKFKQDLNDLSKAYYKFQPLFEVAFPKALTFKRKFYQAIIDDEAIKYLNSFHDDITNSINDNARKYHIHIAISKIIHSKLIDVSQIIQERNYSTEQFDPKYGKLQSSREHAEDAFIIFYLKHTLVRLYLEVQDNYKSLVKAELMDEEDIYLTYFYHSAPIPPLIIEAEKTKVASPTKPLKTISKDKDFKPLMMDLRNDAKGVLPYDTIIKTPNKFARFEEQLYQNEYIDKDYNFTDKYGFKNHLAAIYHILIRKGYFNKRNFKPAKEIKESDVYKFLDHRYATDVNKQFRNYRQNPEKVDEFIDSHYWLDKLPLG